MVSRFTARAKPLRPARGDERFPESKPSGALGRLGPIAAHSPSPAPETNRFIVRPGESRRQPPHRPLLIPVRSSTRPENLFITSISAQGWRDHKLGSVELDNRPSKNRTNDGYRKAGGHTQSDYLIIRRTISWIGEPVSDAVDQYRPHGKDRSRTDDEQRDTGTGNSASLISTMKPFIASDRLTRITPILRHTDSNPRNQCRHGQPNKEPD